MGLVVGPMDLGQDGFGPRPGLSRQARDRVWARAGTGSRPGPGQGPGRGRDGVRAGTGSWPGPGRGPGQCPIGACRGL